MSGNGQGAGTRIRDPFLHSFIRLGIRCPNSGLLLEGGHWFGDSACRWHDEPSRGVKSKGNMCLTICCHRGRVSEEEEGPGRRNMESAGELRSSAPHN